MDMNEKLALVSGFLPNVKFFSAGKLVYVDTEKGRKKHLLIPHKDGHPINNQTNTLKMQLADKYLVIDCDGADLDELAKLYPSIENTFTTRTTDKGKRHFYFNPVEGLKGIRKTGLQAEGEYDIFTTGVMFEGHTIPEQPMSWEIVNDSEVASLTEGEIDLIKHLCRNQTHDQNGSNDKTPFLDMQTADLVIKCVAEGKLPEDKKTHKMLMFGINNKDYREKYQSSRSRVPFPEFNHINFNTIAYKTTYNQGISHTTRDKFLNLILKDAYEIDPDSPVTYSHLHKSILATLPRHEALDRVLEADDFIDSIQPSIVGGRAVIKFMSSNSKMMYIVIDPVTCKPLQLGQHGGMFNDLGAILDMFGYSKEDMQMVQQVIVVNDPYSPLLGFDDDSNLTRYNLANQTVYYDKSVATPTKPDNVLTRLITSYFGNEYQDFYYHWLAHVMYGKRVPQTMPMLVSTKTDVAATGKSSLAQAIPSRLVSASATIDPLSVATGWGDVIDGMKLICMNDMKAMSRKTWEPVYSFAKDRSTKGAKRRDNMKFGSFKDSYSSYGFSFSANWIPPIDEHDRRLWVVFPQMIYGDTKLLSGEDSKQLNYLLEGSEHDEYHKEFQELANYLKYLYKNHKDDFREELFLNAPITVYRAEALKQQRNYSESLLGAMVDTPQALEDLVGSDNMLFISKFITLQYDNGYVYLPTAFVVKMLNSARGTNDPYNNRKLCDVLGVQQGAFTNRGTPHTLYKDKKNLAMYDESEQFEIEQYKHAQLKHPMDTSVADMYVKYLQDNSHC